MPDADTAFEALIALHDEVDRKAAALAARHTGRLQCGRGCAGCCVDGLTVFAIEAERIRRRNPELLASAAPHPPGGCAFLDADGACRIYADRPYVCRTQGLPLRWLDRGSASEQRDICPLNDDPEHPIVELAADDCWLLGPVEGRLATLQIESGGTPPRREALRDLFTRRGA